MGFHTGIDRRLMGEANLLLLHSVFPFQNKENAAL